MGIIETSPGRPAASIAPPVAAAAHPPSYHRAYSASKSSGSTLGGSSKNHPVVPSTMSGRAQHRYVVTSPTFSPVGASKKITEKQQYVPEDQEEPSLSSEDEGYVMSTWNSSKNEKVKKPAIKHPASAPLSSRKAKTGAAANATELAWQPSGVAAATPPLIVNMNSGSGSSMSVQSRMRGKLSASTSSNRGEAVAGAGMSRPFSTAVARSRSSSQDADNSSSLSTHGASGNYFTTSKNVHPSGTPVGKRGVGTSKTAAIPMTLSDFEDEDVCVTSDEDANIISADDGGYIDDDEHILV